MLPPSSLISGWLPCEDVVADRAFSFFCWRRRKNQNNKATSTMRPPAPTPTPTPIFAPVDNPPLAVPAAAALVVADAGVSETVEPFIVVDGVAEIAVLDASLVDVDPAVLDASLVDVGPVVVSVVVVAETNRLLSDACISIRIACAHIVIGPETCVLSSSTWRTVTMVDDELGNCFIHPPNVVNSALDSV